MIIGVCVHSRRQLVTCFPPIPGSPRSRRMRSGRKAGTTCNASSPVEASLTEYPCASREARRKPRIPASSSTISTLSPGLLTSLLQWQKYGYLRSSFGTPLGEDAAIVGFHESLADREAKACPFGRSWDGNTVKFIEHAFEFALWNPPSTIENPNFQLAGIQPSLDFHW